MLVASFDHARGMFQPYSWHNLTVLEVCRHSSDISTVLDRVTIVLVVCFDHARGNFWPCSVYVSANLKISITHARGMFQSFSS